MQGGHLYQFTRLSPDTFRAYQSLVPEELLNSVHSDLSIIAIGASLEDKPIGIALATVNRSLQFVDVVHLFVNSEHRNRHVGRQLLAKLKEEAKREGGTIFSLVYPIEEAVTPAIEKVIAANRWKGTRPFMIRCWFDVLTFNIPWIMNNEFQYPPGLVEFPWHAIKEEEKLELDRQERQRWFRPYISPRRDEGLLEKLNSLGLRYQGNVVGWMLTHRIRSDTIRYTSIYVDRHIKNRGLVMAKLLADSIHLHLTDRINHPLALFEIPLLQVSPSWKRFIEKRLLPYANKTTVLYQAWD